MPVIILLIFWKIPQAGKRWPMVIKANCVSKSGVTLCSLRTLAFWHCFMCWELIFFSSRNLTFCCNFYCSSCSAMGALLWPSAFAHQFQVSGSVGAIHQLYINYSKENSEYLLSWSSCWWWEANKRQSKYIQRIHTAPHPTRLLFLYTGI